MTAIRASLSIYSIMLSGVRRGFRGAAAVAAVAMISLSCAGLVHAQSATTWTGGGGDNNWNTSSNWNGGAPTTSGTWAITFSGTTRPTNSDNILPAITVSNLTISTGTAFTINRSSTASITLINGGTFSNTANFTHSWYVPLTLGGTATFSIPTGRVNLQTTTSSGTLIKTGAGELQLYGSDYSTTAIRVQGGNLGFSSGSQTPLGSVSLVGGGLIFARSGFKTPSNLNLRPARTCDYKADRKESFDEPPRIRTD